MAVKTMTVQKAIEEGAVHPLEAPTTLGLYLGIPEADLAEAEAEAAKRGLTLSQLIAERYMDQLSAEIDEHRARE